MDPTTNRLLQALAAAAFALGLVAILASRDLIPFVLSGDDPFFAGVVATSAGAILFADLRRRLAEQSR